MQDLTTWFMFGSNRKPLDKFGKSLIFFFLAVLGLCGLSVVAASGGYSLLWCAGFSLQWLPLLRSTGSRHAGFSSCGTQAQ